MKKFLKVLTTTLFGVLLFSGCALLEPMYDGSDIYPVAANRGSSGECYWGSGGDLHRIPCPRVRQLRSFGPIIPFWWNVGPMYNRYNYYRPYYVPQYIPRSRNNPPRRDGNGVVTKDGYKETPSKPPTREAKPRTGGSRGGPFFDKEVPLRERMPWLYPSCDPTCGQPRLQPPQPLKFEFKLKGLEKYNEVLRYNHTHIVEK